MVDNLDRAQSVVSGTDRGAQDGAGAEPGPGIAGRKEIRVLVDVDNHLGAIALDRPSDDAMGRRQHEPGHIDRSIAGVEDQFGAVALQHEHGCGLGPKFSGDARKTPARSRIHVLRRGELAHHLGDQGQMAGKLGCGRSHRANLLVPITMPVSFAAVNEEGADNRTDDDGRRYSISAYASNPFKIKWGLTNLQRLR